jgi:hypothetical protein
MQPINLSVQIYINGVTVFSGRKYRSRSVTGPVIHSFETMVHGLRRIVYREGDMNQSMVKALAFIPERDRVHITRTDAGWVNEELCWVSASIASNSKGRDSHVLAAFVESNALEWLAEEKL